MTSNYEFLEMLHRELEPRGYLEIGVRHGDSLRLAQCPAIGVDPAPVPWLQPHSKIFQETSDSFFAQHSTSPLNHVDLVYIDGMHLYEYALRDFLNVVRWANERTVIVFDDTHPYNQAIATRAQPPGDWTGDVWKTMELIESCMDFGSMKSAQVDVSPTGAFVVWDLKVKFDMRQRFDPFLSGYGLDAFTKEMNVPGSIIDRADTIPADEVIKQIQETRT